MKTFRVEEIDWSRKNPCNDCPFLKTSPFHTGIANSIPATVKAIEKHQFAHTCHKTDNRPECDGPKSYPGKTQHCAGAVLMLLKTGRSMDLQIPLLRAAEAGMLDLADMTRRAKASKNIFTVPQFLRFYAEQVIRIMREEAEKL